MRYNRVGYDKKLQEQTLAFMTLHGEYSDTAADSLEEGDEFVLTYLRNGRTMVSWPVIYDHLNDNPRRDTLHEVSERETLREAIIDLLEADLLQRKAEMATHFQ